MHFSFLTMTYMYLYLTLPYLTYLLFLSQADSYVVQAVYTKDSIEQMNGQFQGICVLEKISWSTPVMLTAQVAISTIYG